MKIERPARLGFCLNYISCINKLVHPVNSAEQVRATPKTHNRCNSSPTWHSKGATDETQILVNNHECVAAIASKKRCKLKDILNTLVLGAKKLKSPHFKECCRMRAPRRTIYNISQFLLCDSLKSRLNIYI